MKYQFIYPSPREDRFGVRAAHSSIVFEEDSDEAALERAKSMFHDPNPKNRVIVLAVDNSIYAGGLRYVGELVVEKQTVEKVVTTTENVAVIKR